MSSPYTHRPTASTILLVAAFACSKSDAAMVTYEAHDGGAVFPNKRPSLTGLGSVLGFVSDNGSDTLSILNLEGNRPALTVPVGRDPVGIDGPHHLALDAAGYVYVALAYPVPSTSPGPHSAHSSSKRPGYVQKLAPDDLRVVGEAQVDPNPGDIVLTPDGSRILVTHFDLQRATDPKLRPDDRKATLAVLDASKLDLAAGAEVVRISVCIAPHGLAVAGDGHSAIVACYGEDSIAVVDLVDLTKPVVRVPIVGGATAGATPVHGPYSIVISPDGKLAAFGNTESKTTRFFDLPTSTITQTAVQSQGAPYFPAWSRDGVSLYIPTQAPDAIVVANVSTGAISSTRTFDAGTCSKPHEAVLSADGSSLYVVCEGDHVAPSVVLALNPTTLETVATVPVGVYPDRLVVRKIR